MPSHALQDPTRRKFCAGALVAAGTVAFPSRALRAAGGERSPITLLVVSDTHLGYRDQPHAEERWRNTAAALQAADGALVLHLGDVVDGGREAQYPKYVAIRDTIGKPVHEIPGNHDPQTLFEKYVRAPVDLAVEHQWLRILLLNNARTESHDGFLSGQQIDWIDGQCRIAARQQQFVLVCMHVPGHANRHPDRGWYVKPENGQTRFYETLDRHRDRVLALFHGHFHNGIRGWDDRAPVHEVAFPSALYNQDRRLAAQQAPGYNLAEFRPGFTSVTLTGGTMHLRYHPVPEAASVERRCLTPQTA